MTIADDDVTAEMIEAGIAASDRLALGCASVEAQCRAIYTAMHAARTDPSTAEKLELAKDALERAREVIRQDFCGQGPDLLGSELKRIDAALAKLDQGPV